MIAGGIGVIDTHVHFWSLERLAYDWLGEAGPEYNRTHLPQEFTESATRASATVTGLVFVQADPQPHLNLEEAAWVHELAAAGVPVMAIVAGANLERGPSVRDELDKLAAMPLVSGVRRLLQDEPPGFAVADQFVDGVRELGAYGLSMDLCIRQRQLPEAIELVTRCPEVQFVLDHFGKPVIEHEAYDGWAAGLERLAALPNVACKLSGLTTEASPDKRNAAALAPWFEHALSVFGAQRCMFGSDWPLVDKASDYATWVDIVIELLEGLSVSQRDAVLHGNAQAIYHPRNRVARAKEC